MIYPVFTHELVECLATGRLPATDWKLGKAWRAAVLVGVFVSTDEYTWLKSSRYDIKYVHIYDIFSALGWSSQLVQPVTRLIPMVHISWKVCSFQVFHDINGFKMLQVLANPKNPISDTSTQVVTNPKRLHIKKAAGTEKLLPPRSSSRLNGVLVGDWMLKGLRGDFLRKTHIFES